MGGPDDLTPLDEFDNCQIILEGGLTLPCAGKEPAEVPLGALDRNGPWGDVARAWDEALERLRSAEPAIRRENQRQIAENQRTIDRTTSAILKAAWMDLQAFEIDKLLPKDPEYLREMMSNPELDVEVRAKVLEVILLRGGSKSLVELNAGVFGTRPRGQSGRSETELEGHPAHTAYVARQYQGIAMDLIQTNDAALFDKLSESKDQLPPPCDRVPATQLMHIMLQEGGWGGSFEHRQVVEQWIRDMPPETRGRAMYHVRDAVDAREIGLSSRVTGIDFSIGVDGVGEIGGGVQWEYRGDTHWQTAGRDILQAVSRDLDAKPDEKYAFQAGYRMADPALDDLPPPPAPANP